MIDETEEDIQGWTNSNITKNYVYVDDIKCDNNGNCLLKYDYVTQYKGVKPKLVKNIKRIDIETTGTGGYDITVKANASNFSMTLEQHVECIVKANTLKCR